MPQLRSHSRHSGCSPPVSVALGHRAQCSSSLSLTQFCNQFRNKLPLGPHCVPLLSSSMPRFQFPLQLEWSLLRYWFYWIAMQEEEPGFLSMWPHSSWDSTSDCLKQSPVQIRPHPTRLGRLFLPPSSVGFVAGLCRFCALLLVLHPPWCIRPLLLLAAASVRRSPSPPLLTISL